jgi:lysozyme
METSPTHDTIWTTDDAIAFVRGQKESDTTQWKGMCLSLAANAYGYSASNVEDVDADTDKDVADYWARVKSDFKHENDRRPPLGGLAIFGGPERHGHICVVTKSNGDDVVLLANDDLNSGLVRPLSIGAIESGLNLTYLGWAEPHFPRGLVGNPQGLPEADRTDTVFARALSFGNRDSDSVRLLQRRLLAVLANDLPETGEYDAATRKAVGRFQSRCCRFTGDAADGLMFDPETKSGGEVTTRLLFPTRKYDVKRGAVPDSDNRIAEPPDAHVHPEPTRTLVQPIAGLPVSDPDEPDPMPPSVDFTRLAPGKRNKSVLVLQQRLNKVINAGLAETSLYDDATVEAVRAWQVAIGDVDFADGVLGPRQFARLFPIRKFKRAGAPTDDTHLLSPEGEEFIVEFEGFSSKLYNDQAGHCTIGVGHLVHLGNCNTHEGGLENGITKTQAIKLMRGDAKSKVDAVDANVKVPLTQAQFDALVSFTFNVGEHNFETSTLLKKLNAGELDAVPTELKRWNKITVNGKKVASKGLTRRRAREGKLFEQGVYAP